MTDSLSVDAGRLWQSLMDMGAIGALPNGGCCRTALSPEDKAGRDLFVKWCRDAGCEVRFDRVGNIFARRPGSEADLPAVATGSHLDTQPHAGKFDGVYGVLAGLEVVRALNDQNIKTRAPIDVVVWTNEEGVRFSPPLAGSSAFAGKFSVDDILEAQTLDGTTVGEDLQATGYCGDEHPGARAWDSFFEAHIEQGPVLEETGNTIGVVTGVQGVRWSRVTLQGQDAHAGTTPMDRRRDALLGAARAIDAANRIAVAVDERARLTVGRLEISPNSGATVPGRAEFVIDNRHPEIETLDRMDREIRANINEIARAQGLTAKFERTIDAEPVPFDAELISIVKACSDRLGYASMELLSGAGHDAMNIAKRTPTAMIFVPCEGGISHNEAENATPEDLAAGAHVLLHAMLTRAGTA